ncbi:GNAT family N-acetyltransferase [Ruminiclostridium cellobioparum]|uniref:N-acetyltransferase domain-containing protein n=1 Tax=Ruminiclostridium cellobioparum subsp. termitidis CT1112 TaxID=1195236 RepID=S0FWN5_RUMCE|nr:GNAT family N-acetyltransferase [Ruminiclostridium cellobioparum]EMS72958.1 hypothetical protein CTER_1134 [Ruminiclostridium cellobioparum subsp. termitidis CT1112]
MAVELTREEFAIAEGFFNKTMFQIPALAVINSRFPGKVFVDNKENPRAALVWALSRWSYLSCTEFLPRHISFIMEVLNTMIFPILGEVGESDFEVYCDNNAIRDSILNEALKNFKVNNHHENTFILNRERFEKLDFEQKLTRDLEICECILPIVPEVYHKYYPYEKFGRKVFGMAVTKNGELISQCMNNGFAHGNRYFIDLDTFSNSERNKGYGTLISYHLIINQLKKGLLPLWETTVDNMPSQKVAYKLGFEKAEEYTVYTITKF